MSAFKTNYSRIFDSVKEYGHLKGVALDVFGIICANPGLTAGEVFREYVSLYPNTTRSRNEIAKRINDLANWMAVKADGQTICPESGRRTYRWTPTGNLPSREPRLVLNITPKTDVVTGNTDSVLLVGNALLQGENSSLKLEVAQLKAKISASDAADNELRNLLYKISSKASINTINHLRDLQSRARLVTKFRWFVSKRMAAQAALTVEALQVAIEALS